MCNFASSFGWVVVVVFMFSCVLGVRIRCASFWLLCETWRSYNRVGPEEIVMVFNKFQSMAQNPSGMFPFRVWAWISCKHGEMLIRLVMLRAFCSLAVDVVLHAASKDVCSVFNATRLSVFWARGVLF